MKRMRKILAPVLVAIMLLGLTAPAFASENREKEDVAVTVYPYTIDYTTVTLSFSVEYSIYSDGWVQIYDVTNVEVTGNDGYKFTVQLSDVDISHDGSGVVAFWFIGDLDKTVECVPGPGYAYGVHLRYTYTVSP